MFKIKEILLKPIQKAVEKQLLVLFEKGIDPSRSLTQISNIRKNNPGISRRQIAKKLIKKAGNKAAVGGAAGGAGTTMSEALITLPDPTTITKIAGISGIAASIAADAAATTHAQIQLIYNLAALYDVPYRLDEKEEAWTIILASQGAKGIENAGGKPVYLFESQGKAKFLDMLYQGLRRSSLEWVRRIVLLGLAKQIAAKSILLAAPVVNAAFAAGFNFFDTNRVGKWSWIRARIRKKLFLHLNKYVTEFREYAGLVPFVIFHATTTGDKLTASGASLFQQSLTYLKFSQDEEIKIAETIKGSLEEKNIYGVLNKIDESDIKKDLFEIAILVNAASTLSTDSDDHRFMRELAQCLGVKYIPARIGVLINELKRN